MLPETPVQLAMIATSLLLLGMSKGGFPIGTVALPLLILVWPDQTRAARTAISFMLPMLCCMDVVAVWCYRKHIRLDIVKRLLPATLVGVLVAALLFVEDDSPIAVPEDVLKGLIGGLGLTFVLYRMVRRKLIARMGKSQEEHPAVAHALGFSAGIASTMAHAAGPIMQMHLLPKGLPKVEFAGTMAGYFFVLNLVKLIPFVKAGRISADNLKLGAYLLPVIPLGVLLGVVIVRHFQERHYTLLIYSVLTIASVTLLVKAMGLL